MRNRRLLLVVGLVCAAPFVAGAQVTQVFAPAGLGSGLTVHTFESMAGGPGATYSAPSGVRTATSEDFSENVTTSGVQGLTSIDFPETITITFAGARRAVGLYFGNDDVCCSTPFDAILDAFNGMSLIGSVSVAANMNDFVDQFLGFTSTVNVTSVQLRYVGGEGEGLYHFIDDVQFGPRAISTIPEPTTVALVGGGLLALAGVARRRRNG